MRSFDYSRLYEKAWDTDILNLVAKIHECKGRQDLFIRQKPVELDCLVEIAKRQSTEASNKIEGIVTTSTRMKQLFEEKTTPKNRDEDEIMGYRDVLNTIRESNEYIRIRPSYILQLHRDLLKRAGFSYGGHFKNVQNYIKPDGTVVTRFTPIAMSTGSYSSADAIWVPKTDPAVRAAVNKMVVIFVFFIINSPFLKNMYLHFYNVLSAFWISSTLSSFSHVKSASSLPKCP